ncbi:SusD-like starch-binding protein associating with outer membrane [Pontibacter mucosus]|uniref:SusD-like starch-binding protein associating with outer membrane n=1 Tax=Pontibacter mucosus TaxID=1649266 RepID=A0A2T5YFF7_9BACT|nr:SusD/RagB family nutrient-binding outer membrane lipoprotein [Pontibacter mucosus]PTX18055.1 SusD-like starch-binding protein associating with outer membrane [Pontibacter mucosus]
MKNILKKSWVLMATGLLLTSCNDFEEINVSPVAANADQVQVEYFINNSIISAQMNPDVAERSFILYWKVAAHYQEGGTLSAGGYNDGWTSAYYNQVASWLNAANTAIEIANGHISSGNTQPYTNNLLQVARIWRAYLMSEMSDNFGPIPINAFQGENPEFSDVKSVYYFTLEELKDASAKLDASVETNDRLRKLDPAYAYNWDSWKKYANSLRLRLAMRLSEVDPAKAQSEFEAAAASSELILSMGDVFKVQERPGWDALSGVMSREWNAQFLSQTLFNTYFNLGGVESRNLLGGSFHSAIKPADWLGQRFENHFATKTNNPSAGYWFNGLPHAIDPRAYESFIIPGDFSNPNFSNYPSWTTDARNTKRQLLDDNGNVLKEIDATNTWNSTTNGSWGAKGAKNRLYTYSGTIPRMSHEFRTSQSQRVFFGPWETYFLIAEAALRGWSTPMGAKDAYEAGIASSFEYWNLPMQSYLSSEEYNRNGTSVSWDHTAEPPATQQMQFENGYTGEAGQTAFKYPDNHLYKNGTVKNDHLTKIITQKYISQFPWLPLEAWNDHRRLGLPFFENPAVENPLPNLQALNSSNYMESRVEFFPQRLRYPSSLINTNPAGYDQAVGALGGPDAVSTPLWWAQKK